MSSSQEPASPPVASTGADEAGAAGQPRGELAIRMLAMPANTNPAGDIFGGWIMSIMDIAAGVAARTHARGRVATAAVSHLSFLAPVKVGDIVCCYASLVRIGRSSMVFDIETWTLLADTPGARQKVTEAQFTMVAVDANGRPRPVPQE